MATTEAKTACAAETLTERLGEMISKRYDRMSAKEIDKSQGRLKTMLSKLRASRGGKRETA